ncbi:hypothetical protein KKG81_04470 [bacterium]|nr:hypothetical protein [bacterium]
MGMSTGQVIALVAVLVLAFGGLTAYGVNKLSTISTETQTETTETIVKSDFCSNNPKLDLNARLYDALATTTAYLNGTLYLKNLDTGSVTTQTISVGATNSAFTTLSDVLQCTSEKGYEVYVQTAQDTNNANGVFKITPDMLQQDPVEITIDASQHSLLKVKAYDMDARANLYGANSRGAKTGGDNTTDFVNVNASVEVFTTSTGTAKTIAANGFLKYELTFEPQSANQAGGKEALFAMNIADDSNADDWDPATLYLKQDGVMLSEAALSANDVVALNAYEKVYKAAHPVGMTADGDLMSQSTVEFYVKTQSGINADFDPRMRYVELGDYQGQKTDTRNTILTGVGFRDDSSRTAVGSATSQTILFDIS